MIEVNIDKGSEKLMGGLQVKAHEFGDYEEITEVLIRSEDVQYMIDRLEAYKQTCKDLGIWND